MLTHGDTDRSWLSQGVASNIVSNLIWLALAAIGGVLVGVLKANQSLYTTPLLFGLAAFLMLLGSIALLRLIFSGAQNPKTVTSKKAGTAIRDWVDKAGYEIRSLAGDGFRFRYIVTVNGRKIEVNQKVDSPHYLRFYVGLTFNEEDNRTLSKLPGGIAEVVRSLRIHLAAFRIGYSGIGVPLERIDLNKHILITNSFNEHEFYKALFDVEAGLVLATELVQAPFSPLEPSVHQPSSPSQQIPLGKLPTQPT